MNGFIPFVFVLLLSVSREVAGDAEDGAACSSYLTVHEILSVEGGVMTIDDEYGMREVKATTYDIGLCSTHGRYVTGMQYVGNYSFIGLTSPLGSDLCVTKKIGGNLVMESMQAIVVRTNGWMIEPQSIDMDDIDSQVEVPLNEAWMESAACFAMADGKMVLPQVDISSSALLTPKEYVVPQDAMKKMGLSLGESLVPGAEYSGKYLYNCPFAKSSPDAVKCRMNLSFNKPVDTIVFLYGLKQASFTGISSAIFISQIDMKCGCRCTSESIGSRVLALPLKGVENQCSAVRTSSPRTECDILGKKWCGMENSYAYKIGGEQLPNGNYHCHAESAYMSRVLSNFTPAANFMPTV